MFRLFSILFVVIFLCFPLFAGENSGANTAAQRNTEITPQLVKYNTLTLHGNNFIKPYFKWRGAEFNLDSIQIILHGTTEGIYKIYRYSVDDYYHHKKWLLPGLCFLGPFTWPMSGIFLRKSYNKAEEFVAMFNEYNRTNVLTFKIKKYLVEDGNNVTGTKLYLNGRLLLDKEIKTELTNKALFCYYQSLEYEDRGDKFTLWTSILGGSLLAGGALIFIFQEQLASGEGHYGGVIVPMFIGFTMGMIGFFGLIYGFSEAHANYDKARYWAKAAAYFYNLKKTKQAGVSFSHLNINPVSTDKRKWQFNTNIFNVMF